MSELYKSNEEQSCNVNNINTRLNIWQKKLLNLSTSNPLLNCKINKGNLVVLCPNPSKLEDFLADGSKISLVSAETVLDTKISPDLRLLNSDNGILQEKALNALKEKKLPVNVSADKLNSQLIALYRKTKSILEDGGANTLYLAIGFLNWRKNDKTDKIYHAPLVLYPVKLDRTSIQNGVKLSAHEDESRFNTTLSEMLKQDFNIVLPDLDNELPTDESGLDIQKIWNVVKEAVANNDGFEVVEEVVLGHFSFNKYLMWKDLTDRTEEMLNHPIVSAVIDKTKQFPDDGDFISPEKLDDLYKPEDFFVPLSADSSQLAVIAAADKGKSFVIEGPPGTGKSQTISNLIAHLTAKGKSVLFVSEKMAALEVVYRRLEQIGLGNFCLQLHSNKANKKDVINQLKRSWESVSTEKDIEKKRKNKSNELLKIRNELNDTVKEIHKEYSNGLTPYQAMGVCIKNFEFTDLIQFQWDNPNVHSINEYNQIKEIVHKIQIQTEICKNLYNLNTFKYISKSEWAPALSGNIIKEIQSLTEFLPELYNSCSEVLNVFNINIPKINIDIIKNMFELVQILKDKSVNTANYAFKENAEDIIDALENGIIQINNLIKLKTRLHFDCPLNIWKKADGNDLIKKWNYTNGKNFISASIDKFLIKNELKKAGAKGNIVMPDDARIIVEMKEQGDYLLRLNELLKDVKVWNEENSNIEELQNSVNLAKRLWRILVNLSKDTAERNILSKKLNQLLIKGRDFFNSNKAVYSFERKYTEFEDNYRKLKVLCSDNNEEDILKFEKLNTIELFNDLLNEISENEGSLKDWCYLQKLKKEAVKHDLKPLIDNLEKYSADNIETIFFVSYCSWFINTILTKNQILKDFTGLQHSDKIKKFIKLDDEIQKLTIQYIQAKLSEKIPDKDGKNLSAEWKLLNREMQKQRQIKPVRKILSEAGNAVKTLTPCLMMSPLSVAQYLPVSKEGFDVIVFEEGNVTRVPS